MYRKIAILLCATIFLAILPAKAQLSDSQILQYIAEGAAAGKTERQVGNELLARGVTIQQAQQLLQAYRNGLRPNTTTSVTGSPSTQVPPTTMRQQNTDIDDEAPAQRASSDRRPRRGRSLSDTQEDLTEESPLYDENGYKRIYGMDIFSSQNLTFEPNQNLATPEDYVLGPGDELVINIWGVNEVTIRQTISPDGVINVTQIGPIFLTGLTIKEAKGRLRSTLAKTYSSLRSGGSQLSLSLGEVRTIQVNVLGEVASPGTYRLSSFSTVFNALYRAGGISEIGSLRAVRIMRGGELFATVDLYDYIFNGKSGNDVALHEGDVVLVPTYTALVGIDGFVKRPMFYEVKEGEPVSALIGYAGGFSEGAWPMEIHVERNDGRENHISTVASSDFDGFTLRDGDIARVSGSDVDYFTNRVEVQGSVFRPGMFELGGSIATVRQLVEHAGGLLPEAFRGRAQLLREKEDRTKEVRSVPIGALMDGLVEDILLRRNDVLVISDKTEIEPKGDFTIAGFVQYPGEYPYADNTTVEDLILMAGGLAEGASSANVEIARRINDPNRTSASDTLAIIFSTSIRNGLMDDGSAGFTLMPDDVVSVRRNPSYLEQRNVTISGEITYPGQYTLANTGERASQIVARAGGATPNGYVRGAMLLRKLSPYEKNIRRTMTRMVTQSESSKDSLNVEKIEVDEIYTVGIELDKALANPGSDYDIVLRDGDELIIPALSNTVRIQGEVLYPNSVQYIAGKSVSYYVSQAGGFTTSARRNKAYVVYMNGTVAVGAGATLEPGCEIIVPARQEKSRMTTGEWLGIGTSAASIATMVATIVNLFL